MKQTSRCVLAIICLFAGSNLYADKADLVVFSYDRPLQLYAFLESAHMYLSGLERIQVIYRTSSNRYAQAYNQVHKDFPEATFIQQHSNNDFKSVTLDTVFNTQSYYVIFAVDDIIIKDFINIEHAIDLMRKAGAYGFFFRLGKNLTNCYSMNAVQALPPLHHIEDDVWAWTFAQGEHDWKYPHTVDMTLYAKRDIEYMFRTLNYENPNTLEGNWASVASPIMCASGLCYAHSKIVNIPLNRVQSTHANRHMNAFSAQELLEFFEQGLKIDIHEFYKMKNGSAHAEWTPRFIKRLRPYDQDGSKHIVVVAASYNNKDWYQHEKGWPGHLDTIFGQNYRNYHVVYIDDCSIDGTGNLVEHYTKEHNLEDRVTLIKNRTRYGAMENQYRAIHTCKDNDLVVILDGDDAFAHNQVFSYLNHTYTDGSTWLTYGQFIEYPSATAGFCCPMPSQIIHANAFREFPHIPSHLRTFYAGLFKQINHKDLMHEGSFLAMNADEAAMFPMIEMARQGHFKFIPHILCVYNGANSLNDHKVSKELQKKLDREIRSRKRYAPAANYMRN
jgi:glycosyl transferase family 2